MYTAEHATCERVECKSRHHGVAYVSVKLYRHIFLHMSNSVLQVHKLGFKQTRGKGGNTSPVLTGIAVVDGP